MEVIVTSNGLMDQEWFKYSWSQVYEANKGKDVTLKIQYRGDNWELLGEEVIGNCQNDIILNDYYKAQIKLYGRIKKEAITNQTNTNRESGVDHKGRNAQTRLF